jgi:DNA-binding LacI/PurR family transcriptional regulator
MPPTAVFCYNDMSAAGALASLRVHGCRVPKDISLAGFDDLLIASYVDPPLTAARQPKRPMGRLAMEILLKLFSDDRSETSIKVQGKLVVRESTAPPP